VTSASLRSSFALFYLFVNRRIAIKSFAFVNDFRAFH